VYVPVEGELPAVIVRIADVLPPAGTATGLGRVIVTPLGAAPIHAADRLIEELKPFSDDNIIVVDLETPGVKVMTPGEDWVEKSGVGEVATMVPEGVTISWSVATCVMPPLIAFTVNGYVPVATVPGT
jgi:hypothetical protein